MKIKSSRKITEPLRSPRPLTDKQLLEAYGRNDMTAAEGRGRLRGRGGGPTSSVNLQFKGKRLKNDFIKISLNSKRGFMLPS